MTPYSRPSVEIAVASQVSPTGARAAGRHGVGLLSIGATSAGGFNALASNWAIAEELAKDNGTAVDRAGLAAGRPDAHRRDARRRRARTSASGWRDWLYYFREVANLPLAPADVADPVDAFLSMPASPWSARPTTRSRRSSAGRTQSGGFGCFLLMAHNWADWAETKRSYELFARYVAPQFQDLNVGRDASMEWARVNHDDFIGRATKAVTERIARHIEEKGTDNIAAEIAKNYVKS